MSYVNVLFVWFLNEPVAFRHHHWADYWHDGNWSSSSLIAYYWSVQSYKGHPYPASVYTCVSCICVYVSGAFRLSYGCLCRLFILSEDGWVCGEEWWRQVVWPKRGLDRIGRMQVLAEGGGDGIGVSPVDRVCPKQHCTPHPPNCFSFSTLLPIFPCLLFLTPSVSLYLSPPLFFSFQNALLTKRFTNPGWYIIHDRLLRDWFKQMDSEREGGMDRGGLHGKDGKGESEKGCVPQSTSFTKPPHGPRWIFPFLLHFEKPYIKCSLYSLYVQGEVPSPWGQSGWGWTMIFLHMHAWSIFRGFLDMYDIIMTEIWLS